MLATVGYVVVPGVGPHEVRPLLSTLGEIEPFLDSWKYDVDVRDEVSTMYTARSFGHLYPHLDKYEWPHPPDLVALYGRTADSNGEGVTHVCDMTDFLAGLDTADRHRLESISISFEADEGLQAVGIDHRHAGPALDRSDPARPRFRFSYNYAKLPADDPGFAHLWDRTVAWYEAHKRSVLLTEDTLLLWRNAVVLHSRDSFTDRARFLWRVYLRDRSRAR